MASLLSFTKIFIFFLITLLFSISNADFSPPYKLVDKVCNKLQDTDVCFQILESDDRSKFAENITILTTIAFNQTCKLITKWFPWIENRSSWIVEISQILQRCVYSCHLEYEDSYVRRKLFFDWLSHSSCCGQC